MLKETNMKPFGEWNFNLCCIIQIYAVSNGFYIPDFCFCFMKMFQIIFISGHYGWHIYFEIWKYKYRFDIESDYSYR